MAATITFSNPAKSMGNLTVEGVDELTWDYELNTQTYPTYGGEVIQILSTAIDNLMIKGTVTSYAKMEEIYAYFLKYMNVVPKDRTAANTYVTMKYLGWSLQIIPKQLPEFQYGRDVVAPTWQLIAAVDKDDPTLNEITIDKFEQRPAGAGAIKTIGTMKAGIGYLEEQDNPFSSFLGDPRFDEKDKKGKAKYEADEVRKKATDKLADEYNNIIKPYWEGDWEDFIERFDGSKPSFLSDRAQDENKKEEGEESAGDKPSKSGERRANS